MLQSIRDGLGRHKWLQYTLLGALALVFAAWGAYGIVNLNVQNASYAAEANGQKISLQEARDAWLRMSQERLGGAELPDALRSHFQDQVLEGLIREALMTDRTHGLGYRPAMSALSDAITKEPAFQFRLKVALTGGGPVLYPPLEFGVPWIVRHLIFHSHCAAQRNVSPVHPLLDRADGRSCGARHLFQAHPGYLQHH